MKVEKFFLGQDVYGNWYVLPESMRKTWNRLIAREDAYNYDAWTEIEKHKADISKLSFENPQIKP